jgi:hypothetical protein
MFIIIVVDGNHVWYIACGKAFSVCEIHGFNHGLTDKMAILEE